MPYIVDVQTSFPKNRYTQDELIDGLKNVWKEKVRNLNRVETIQKNVLVDSRHLAMPLIDYFSGLNFGDRNAKFIEVGLNLFEEAALKILQRNNLGPQDISSLWSNTVTGFAIPSLEARLMNRIDFNAHTKRIPLLGLGCMAGIAGINRAAEYLLAKPKEALLFMSVELCSLTFQVDDVSVANLVSTGLFGDGAAVVLMVGDEHPLASNAPMEWLDAQSIFFPDSEDVMGWDVSETGLKIILNKNVPDVTENNLPRPLAHFFKSRSLERGDIHTFIAHPGGPKVLLAMEKVFDLPERGLVHSWESLRENGNMSSVSVLDIFSRTLEKARGPKGSLALGVAMGPAFSAELGLYRWN
jgi:alkylresorcinol/alkylpyrone synthase